VEEKSADENAMTPAVTQLAPLVYPLMCLTVAWVVYQRAVAAGLSQDTTILFVVSSAVGVVIGARAFFLVVSAGLTSTPVSEWIRAQGTASWGGYLGALSGALLYGRFVQGGSSIFVDALASCAALSNVIGRWSCLLYGDDFGKPTSLPWAIRFPPGSLSFRTHVARGAIDSGAEWSLPVHPMQLYLMAAALVVFVVTTWYWKRFRQVPWSTLGAYLLLDGSLRLPLEFFRDPAAGGSESFGSTSQVMCLLFIVAGSTVVITSWKRLGARVPPSPSILPIHGPTKAL
jgi:phosphatidylglycerol:prolipoprotein diacylglycerol transferase